jgi:hypothetical protein
MAISRKTGGRRKGSRNKKTELILHAVTSGSTPMEFLLAVMQSSDVPLEQRLRAAALAAPFCHVKPVDAAPKIVEVFRHAIEPGRSRALELTLRKFSGGISDEETAELAALNAQVVNQ